ncbi:MAG: hypothetical protein KC549_02340, partial [Myxococcales bacterium]|nr:hypothetical protein [Myxococcales bacterium]
DCDDFGCSRTPEVSVCPREDTNALCSDGIDNDENGFIDCDDFGCARNPAVGVCAPAAVDCQACVDAAVDAGGACRESFATCAGERACQGLLQCLAHCEEQACVDRCAVQFEGGVPGYLAIEECLTVVCADACAQ